MARRQLLPTKNLSLISENVPTDKNPTFNEGIQDFMTDQNLRQSRELERGTAKPLPVPVPVPVPQTRGRMMVQGDHGRPSFSSDDNALNKQILATHALDHEDFNVKPVLSIVEEIMRLATPFTVDSTDLGTDYEPHLHTINDKTYHSSTFDDKNYHSSKLDDKTYNGSVLSDKNYSSYHDADMVKVLAFPINKISCEIVCKCAAGAEAHSVTMDLLKSLSNYSWDAKAVITFAAFAINYGEFWLVEQHHTKNLLAKNIATLKDLPDTMEQAGDLRKKFEAVVDLLTAALKVTHCVIEFKELPSQYISHESQEMAAATAHIPTAIYWIIRSLLACASVLLNLIGSGHEYITSTAESWEILSLTHKLSVMMDHLQKQLKICTDMIETKKAEDAYIAFKKVMEGTHIDNMKVLRAMFRAREDQRPLFDGSKRTSERLEVLRLKHVLLLVTDLDIPHEELNILHVIYNQQTRQEYEVLWFPIVTTTTSLNDSEFYNLRNSMPWHSVEHPSLIEPVATRYTREVWNFVHMPMLVVLDPQGKPSNLDALPMMWIWGSSAFPFTKIKERSLWAESAWNIELLADSIDPRLSEWIRDNRVICLYGGEDIEWIRKFTLSAQAAANAMRIPLEMLYVGKRNPKEKVRRCHEVIDREKLSHIFSVKDYYDYIWFFWVRLLSMWNSKKQIGMTAETDVVMQEIMNVLTFDSSEQGWAVFSRGNHEMTKGKGDILLPVMENYNRWSNRVDHPDKFVGVLHEELQGVTTEHHCNRLILPGHAGYIPERVVCSECGKTMDKYVMYRCCTD